jgi:hypothetical protein
MVVVLLSVIAVVVFSLVLYGHELDGGSVQRYSTVNQPSFVEKSTYFASRQQIKKSVKNKVGESRRQKGGIHRGDAETRRGMRARMKVEGLRMKETASEEV